MKTLKVFLSPHNDDEAIFGSFTIMREKPLVVVITDSHIQFKRGDGITAEDRRIETNNAMSKLGAETYFLGIPDDEITEELLEKELKLIPEIMDARIVFAPIIEGGNPIHDMVGRVANKLFSNVLSYSTYEKTRSYSIGDIEVKPTQEELDLKNKILDEYKSQRNHKYNKIYFDSAMNRSEYFNSTKIRGVVSDMKEQALKNLIDVKEVFDSFNVPFCLMDGTLLGAYRDGDFIKGDYDDTDIGFLEEYLDKIPMIKKCLVDIGFSLPKEFIYNGKFEGSAGSRGGNHVDFFCIHKHKNGKEAYNLGRNFLPNNSKDYMAYVYPVEGFNSFDKLIFKGLEFNMPHNVEEFLRYRYGSWETPVRRGEGFSWLNLEQNPNLKANYEIE